MISAMMILLSVVLQARNALHLIVGEWEESGLNGKLAVSGDKLKIAEDSLPSKYFKIVSINENTLIFSFEEAVFDRTVITTYIYTRKF